ncbi:hypothetical protein ACLBWZ_05065 [Brucellaceae bacterium C25G]
MDMGDEPPFFLDGARFLARVVLRGFLFAVAMTKPAFFFSDHHVSRIG